MNREVSVYSAAPLRSRQLFFPLILWILWPGTFSLTALLTHKMSGSELCIVTGEAPEHRHIKFFRCTFFNMWSSLCIHKHLLESMSCFSTPQKKKISEPCHFMLEFRTLCGPLWMGLFDSFLGGYERLMQQKHLQQFLKDSCKSAAEQLREDKAP